MSFNSVILFITFYSTKIFSPVHKYTFSILCYIAYNYETLENFILYGRAVMLNKLWLNLHCKKKILWGKASGLLK